MVLYTAVDTLVQNNLVCPTTSVFGSFPLGCIICYCTFFKDTTTMQFDSNFPIPLCLKHFLQCFFLHYFKVCTYFFNKILNKIYKSSHLHWYYFSELAFTFQR